jgi:hypothetical protein
MHAEEIGLEGVALLSGRRRNGGPLTREAFESDLRREGFEVVHGGQKAGYVSEVHAHDFDARIMVLGGEITLIREGRPRSSRSATTARSRPAACIRSASAPRASPTSPGRAGN